MFSVGSSAFLPRLAADEPQVAKRDLPPDQVLVEICEQGVPTEDLWPVVALHAAQTYTADVFGFFRVPYKYVDTGIRGDRPIPFLVRASARIDLPAGKHRLLLEPYGYRWFRVGGLDYILKRSEI